MNYYEAIKFIDNWGKKPDEYFVIVADYGGCQYHLAKSPGGVRVLQTSITSLRDTKNEVQRHFYPGDLVRVETKENKE